MIEQAGLEVGTLVEIVPRYAFETPCIGKTGKIVKLTEPRMMARVRIDDESGEPRTFWIEELRAIVAPRVELGTG